MCDHEIAKSLGLGKHFRGAAVIGRRAQCPRRLPQPPPQRTLESGWIDGQPVILAAKNEGVYYDTPARSVAYNVQIMKVTTGGTSRYATIYMIS